MTLRNWALSPWRVFALALAAISLAAGSAAAEVRERVVLWNMAMCPMLWAVMAVPDGWVEDLSAACDSRLAVLVPKGTTLGSGPAAIYARTTPNSDNVSLDDFARNSQARWLKSVPDSKITPIGEVARANGHTAFRLFRYDNPSRPDQAAELGAFTLDRDDKGRSYRVMIMLTTKSERALKKAEPAYRKLLREY